MTTEKLTCLINESDCGREAGNPVCPKCGMDERLVYPSEDDLKWAQTRAKEKHQNERHTVEIQSLQRELISERVKFNAISERYVACEDALRAVQASNAELRQEISMLTLQIPPHSEFRGELVLARKINDVLTEFSIKYRKELLLEASIHVGYSALSVVGLLLLSRNWLWLPAVFLLGGVGLFVTQTIPRYLKWKFIFPLQGLKGFDDCKNSGEEEKMDAWVWYRSESKRLREFLGNLADSQE